MGFGLFKKSAEYEEPEQPKDEYIEVNVMDSEYRPSGKLGIRIEKLEDFADTEKILKSVRLGNVVFLKIKTLKEKDVGELKRAVDKIKKTITANNGDIVGVEQDWLVLTPQFARVERE